MDRAVIAPLQPAEPLIEVVDNLREDVLLPMPSAHVLRHRINGRIHAHMTLATPDKVIGGHMEAGNEVYTYAIVTIGVMNRTNLAKIDDKAYR